MKVDKNPNQKIHKCQQVTVHNDTVSIIIMSSRGNVKHQKDRSQDSVIMKDMNNFIKLGIRRIEIYSQELSIYSNFKLMYFLKNPEEFTFILTYSDIVTVEPSFNRIPNGWF